MILKLALSAYKRGLAEDDGIVDSDMSEDDDQLCIGPPNHSIGHFIGGSELGHLRVVPGNTFI